MSEEELVAAYVDGKISRRVFVRRMMAAGVGAAAALALAGSVVPSGLAYGQTSGTGGSGTTGGTGGGYGSSTGGTGGTSTTGGTGGTSRRGKQGGTPGG